MKDNIVVWHHANYKNDKVCPVCKHIGDLVPSYEENGEHMSLNCGNPACNEPLARIQLYKGSKKHHKAGGLDTNWEDKDGRQDDKKEK